MKKFYVFICLLVVAIMANAEYAGPGFYRVRNISSDSYICIKGTTFKWTSNPDAFWSCIKMLPTQDGTHASDAGSLIYIPSLEQTSLYAQGVDTYSLTELLMDVEPARENVDGLPTYVAKTKTWITMGGRDILFPFYFCDQGTGLTVAGSESEVSHWRIEPVNEETIETSYYGVQPTDEAVKDDKGMYWTTLCCDFPCMIPAEGGVEGAYTVKEVTTDEDGNHCAVAVKVYGQGEVIPAATPVLIKCAAATAEGNKLIPVGEIANNRTFPIVNDLLMGNYFSPFVNHSSMSDASIMTEYVPEQATMASGLYLALGIDADGRLGFFPKAEGTYMDANTAWLNLSDQKLEGMTAVYLVEGEAAPEVVLGDANGDGVVSIKDVTIIVDYLLSAGGEVSIRNSGISIQGADVNGDGVVSIKDVTTLVDMLLANS